MSKFKVGDRVKVEGRGNIGKFIWNKNEMDAMLDKEYIVESVMKIEYLDNNEAYHLEGVFHYFHEHWLTLISKGKQMKKELKKPVAHYKTMIKWVEGRGNLHEKPNTNEMLDDIGESIGSGYCSYCQEFIVRYKCSKECPLDKIGHNCCESSSIYKKIEKAETWAEWLVNAYKLLDVLREIEKEEEEAKRKSEVTYRMGQKFKCDGNEYILARTDVNFGCQLIGVNGNPWNTDRVTKVSDLVEITAAELECMTGTEFFFTLIEEK